MKPLLGLLLAGFFLLSPTIAQAPNLRFPDGSDYLLIEENSLQAKYVAYTPTGTPLTRVITAYSSTSDQTDSTPFITAYNTKVRKGIVASNEFPRGTYLLIDSKIYVVEDKMNSKYYYRIDIWMPSREEALEFGCQTKEILLLD